MATSQHPSSSSLEQFLEPLQFDVEKCHSLAKSLCKVYTKLAKESEVQFLPTPISDSILKPERDGEGRYLAIDIGGTNLRVGFIQLQASLVSIHNRSSNAEEASLQSRKEPSVTRHLEKSWPISEQLKNDQAKDLFAWIGRCIREVVRDGCEKWPGQLPEEIPLGVTFSFPMIQHTLSSATLMGMGKGFALRANLDLGAQLLEGYSSTSTPNSSLPGIKITAITNDAVATLISFTYLHLHDPLRKPTMAIIVGTGTNATIPLSIQQLHPSKHPHEKIQSGHKITINTEWSISGASPPLHSHNLLTTWDIQLDASSSAPGFQPFEYMTSGRYLGELGRLIILDFFITHLHFQPSNLPPKLLQRNGLRTTVLGGVKVGDVRALEVELPPPPSSLTTYDQDNRSEEEEKGRVFVWDIEKSHIVYAIAKAIQTRGSAMVAAAILGLLACAEEISFSSSPDGHGENDENAVSIAEGEVEELLVGYTGGCIDHFQEYLIDCQGFLDGVVGEEFERRKGRKVRVVLEACHDGGIIGAGILAGTVESLRRGG